MAAKIETKISSGFQTVLPAEIREKFGIGPGDTVIWTLIGDEIYVRVRKKGGPDPLLKLIGAFPTRTKTDATAEIDTVVYGGT
ncbi:MAG: AbrB/MazE/SpoVT family DNA-binding domain-containing protein [Candidatus Hadarchaeum sp.]|uniref:AbrB/MazE/SpoVT family DNA-binding domain-containing protein n=1 Tax=Candidatus Hadarchaeum sp. TaxID=2883567 RepID=UPI00317FED11